MSGKKPKSLQNAKGYTDEMFSRKNHGFAHFVVRYYEKNDSGYKYFDVNDVKYYYVVNQQLSNINQVKIRADLIDYWRNTSNVYVLVLNDNYAYEIKATDFIPIKSKFGTVLYQTNCMNSGSKDLLYLFEITKFVDKVDLSKVTENEKLTQYLIRSEQYIEKVAYAKYRKGKNSKEVKVVNTVSHKNQVFKSLKQCFDFMHLETIMNYKKFQRTVNKNHLITIKINETDFVFITNQTCDSS